MQDRNWIISFSVIQHILQNHGHPFLSVLLALRKPKYPLLLFWHPTPALLPGESHGRRRLVGGSPCGR